MWELDYKESWAQNCELWCWRRLLRVPWTARRSNQSILKEISPEYSLEALMLKLKLQYFGHLMQRNDSFENADSGKDWSQEKKGMTEDEVVEWHHQLNGHEFDLTLGVGDGQGGLVCCSPWGRRESDLPEQLNWIDSSVGKKSACNVGDPSLIPGWGRFDREWIGYPLRYSWASLVAQLVKNLLTVRETWVWSLGWKDPLEKGRLPTPVF